MEPLELQGTTLRSMPSLLVARGSKTCVAKGHKGQDVHLFDVMTFGLVEICAEEEGDVDVHVL